MYLLNKYHLASNIKYYFKLVKSNFIAYIIINISVSLLDGVGIALFIPIITTIDSSPNPENSSKFIQALHNLLKTLGVEHNLSSVLFIILLIFVIKGLFRGIQVFYSAKIRFKVIKSIRSTLLKNIASLSFTGYSKQKTGKLINQFTGEIPKLYANMTNLFLCVQNFIMAIIYVVLATIINWKFAIIIIIIAIIIRLSLLSVTRKTQNLSKLIIDKANSLNQTFIQLITNFKYLKATNKISKFSNKINYEINEVEMHNYKIGKLQSLTEALKEPLAIAAIIILLIIQEKNSSGNVEALLISLILVYKAIQNFTILNSSLQSFYQTAGTIESIKGINNELKEYKDHYTGEEKLYNIDNIKLINLSIKYSNTIILNNLNIEINKNEIVAFVGESGSGKSSIISHILGLNKSGNGQLLINGKDFNLYKKGEINSKVGYISQESVILNDTIYNNVTFFDEKTKENLELFWEVVRLASIEDFIKNSDTRENTILGENGLLISGGQRQRISIARELYKRPQLLIMDEATSSLDFETEKLIRKSINKLRGKCTIIIVAHRINTLKDVDKIYVLENKQIISEGNYEHLIQNSPTFRRMSIA